MSNQNKPGTAQKGVIERFWTDPFPAVLTGELTSDTQAMANYQNKATEVSDIRAIQFHVAPNTKFIVRKTVGNQSREINAQMLVRDLPVIDGVPTLSFRKNNSKRLTVGKGEYLYIDLVQDYGFKIKYKLVVMKDQTVRYPVNEEV